MLRSRGLNISTENSAWEKPREVDTLLMLKNIPYRIFANQEVGLGKEGLIRLRLAWSGGGQALDVTRQSKHVNSDHTDQSYPPQLYTNMFPATVQLISSFPPVTCPHAIMAQLLLALQFSPSCSSVYRPSTP